MGEGFFFGRGSELTPPLARFPTLSSLRKRGENMECKESIRYTRFALSDSGSAGKAGKIHHQAEGNLGMGIPVMIFFLCRDRGCTPIPLINEQCAKFIMLDLCVLKRRLRLA